MKIALLADTHFGIKNDNQTFQKYLNKFFSDVFFPYIDEYNIKTIIHLGDLVDRRKTINFLTLNNLRKSFIQPAFDRSITTHIIVGNHDVYYKNTNQINAINELYGEAPFIWSYEDVITTKFDDLKICFVPWICSENYEESMDAIEESDAQIVMGHLEIRGFLLQKGIHSMVGLKRDIFDKFDTVYSGHFHYKSSADNIEYLGTPYQLMWSDYDCEKGFYIFDTDTRALEFIENPYQLFHKIVYDEDVWYDIDSFDFEKYKDSYVKVVVKEKPDSYLFDNFLDRLYSVNPSSANILDETEIFLADDEEVTEAEDTLTILSKYVSNLNIDLDKTVLDGLLRELYSEAVEIL